MAVFFSSMAGSIVKAIFLACVAALGIFAGKKLRDRKDAKEESVTK